VRLWNSWKHKFTIFTTLLPNSNQLGEQSKVPSMCGDPPGSCLPTKEPFGLQKYQFYVYENVFKRYIPSRLLHSRASEYASQHLQLLQRKCSEKGTFFISFTSVLQISKWKSHIYINPKPISDDIWITTFEALYLPRVYEYTLWKTLQGMPKWLRKKSSFNWLQWSQSRILGVKKKLPKSGCKYPSYNLKMLMEISNTNGASDIKFSCFNLWREYPTHTR